MGTSTVIDPAHGGSNPAGRSSAYGARGPQGLSEKDVTLGLARRVAAHLGGEAQLTRADDRNLTLADRASAARRLGARTFVSLHATGAAQGADVWVHTRSGPRSAALADSLSRELGRFGARLRRGDLAVLHPDAHATDEAACVVDVGGLATAGGERALRDARHVDEMAQAIARGVRGFLHGDAPGPTYGRVARALALDLTDFDASQFYVYPADQLAGYPARVTQAELDALKTAWDGMMNGRGVSLTAPADATHARDFRRMLVDCMATSKVVRDAFLFLQASPTTVNLEVGRNNGLFVDGFEWQASSASAQRGWHSLDLDDFDMVPRVSTQQHHYLCTRSSILIHALVEAGNGVRSAIADAQLRYLSSHFGAIDEENRYRQEQGQLGTKGYDQPVANGADIEFHFTGSGGADVAAESWHTSGAGVIDSITYTL